MQVTMNFDSSKEKDYEIIKWLIKYKDDSERTDALYDLIVGNKPLDKKELRKRLRDI